MHDQVCTGKPEMPAKASRYRRIEIFCAVEAALHKKGRRADIAITSYCGCGCNRLCITLGDPVARSIASVVLGPNDDLFAWVTALVDGLPGRANVN